MIKAKLIYILNSIMVLLSFTGSSLYAESVIDKDFKIEGTVNLTEGDMVVISEIAPETYKPVDTVYVDSKGRFTYTGEEEQSVIYYLSFNSADPPGVPIIVENGAHIKLDIVKSDFYDFTVTGGRHNADMVLLHKLYTDFDKKAKKLGQEAGAIDPAVMTKEIQDDMNARYQQMLTERTRDIEQFVRDKPASPATYFAVRFLFQKPEPRLINIAADKMLESYPNSAYTKQLLEYKEQFGAVAEGAIAPNIKLPTPEGDSVDLHSLRGKVVLIDFWASWCGPCRKENPHVKAIYEKYKDKGFEIYGVSLDNNAGQWKAAIEKDGLEWIHVSDLKGWRSVAGKQYGVGSIPQTFLIDKDGRIYKVGLRSDSLEPVLDYLLN